MAATDTLAWRVKNALVNTLKGLNLLGIEDRVYPQLAPDQTNDTYPCFLITSAGQAEDVGDGDTESRDTRFAFAVWLVDRESTRQEDREPQWLEWRKAGIDAFREDQIARFNEQVPEVWNVELEPRPQIDEVLAGQKAYKLLVGGFIVKVTAREPRAA